MSKRILVTGGASGLGRAIVSHYAAAGWRVLIADVAEPGALPAGDVSYQRLDVRSEEDWQRVRAWCESAWGGLDVLVNNAGVAAAGRMERIAPADWEWILGINLNGVIAGCRTFAPVFKEQRGGHLVNISSLAGLMNLPGMASYNVTKAAVISLSETLRYELEPWNIRTTVVCPGFVPTNLGSRLRSPDPVLADVAHKMLAKGTVTPEQVAERVAEAVDKGRFLVHTHREVRVVVALKRLLPRLVDRQITKGWRQMKDELERQDREREASGA
ncbi:SDR family NAD(P)-dependent oxidoreductase [Streptomyces sp. NBC_01803]|uniref:SDR family NAD(P)-dependent oxidoreductase n=1 Tax=Streptomyces sp. NBC_01803 TaxID=2975946 RepID=UPI002DD827C6|nr:SDR family NAD(P)-dependent oxidoreductase [Streptomyces sp. NBC_01803]WSA43373.1 SDR family NAD(P)-dependent oxidoreductase [Streptomyces sp. NBC_01803]